MRRKLVVNNTLFQAPSLKEVPILVTTNRNIYVVYIYPSPQRVLPQHIQMHIDSVLSVCWCECGETLVVEGLSHYLAVCLQVLASRYASSSKYQPRYIPSTTSSSPNLAVAATTTKKASAIDHSTSRSPFPFAIIQAMRKLSGHS